MRIKIIDVSKKYVSGDETFFALRNISLTIEAKRIVALTGPSGSGKTTLLNICGLIDTVSDGTVAFDDVIMTGLMSRATALIRRQQIGFIFQHFNLITVMTLFENVEYPLILLNVPSQERKSRVLEILDRVGIAHLAYKRPEQVSGGQKQRAAIARALVKRPHVIIADEPTASLDTHNASLFFGLLKGLIDEYQVTFLMATHDPFALKQADTQVSLYGGKVKDVIDKKEEEVIACGY